MTDPRIAAVEDNLLAFVETMLALPRFTRSPWPDVHAGHTDIAFPLFNTIAGARFAPGTEARRTREVLDDYLARGLPFLWWTTPSTSSPDLERVLTEAGLLREDTPGMHVALDGPVPTDVPPGVELREVSVGEEPEPFLSTLLAAFGMPDELLGAWRGVLQDFDGPRVVHVLASADGVPAATGTAWLTGSTVGLYNIATLPAFRGGGIGRAVTTRLMDLGAERGAAEAVLHASEMGRPVYERLGFVEVCTVPQFVWVPRH